MDGQQQPANGSGGVQAAVRLADYVHQAVLGLVGLILLWSVAQIVDLTKEAATSRAERFTRVEAMELERRMADQLAADRQRHEAQMNEIRTTLASVSADTAHIRGMIEQQQSNGAPRRGGN